MAETGMIKDGLNVKVQEIEDVRQQKCRAVILQIDDKYRETWCHLAEKLRCDIEDFAAPDDVQVVFVDTRGLNQPGADYVIGQVLAERFGVICWLFGNFREIEGWHYIVVRSDQRDAFPLHYLLSYLRL